METKTVLKPPKGLIIDDDDRIFEMVSTALAHLDFIHASSAQKGLNHIKNDKFDFRS